MCINIYINKLPEASIKSIVQAPSKGCLSCMPTIRNWVLKDLDRPKHIYFQLAFQGLSSYRAKKVPGYFFFGKCQNAEKMSRLGSPPDQTEEIFSAHHSEWNFKSTGWLSKKTGRFSFSFSVSTWQILSKVTEEAAAAGAAYNTDGSW